jgi:hypothetical protein
MGLAPNAYMVANEDTPGKVIRGMGVTKGMKSKKPRS